MRQRLERAVLLAPDFVRRAAAGRAPDAAARWMLEQPKQVRQSYVREVLDAPGPLEVRSEIWMMRQPDAVRETYVAAVLEPRLPDAPST